MSLPIDIHRSAPTFSHDQEPGRAIPDLQVEQAQQRQRDHNIITAAERAVRQRPRHGDHPELPDWWLEKNGFRPDPDD